MLKIRFEHDRLIRSVIEGFIAHHVPDGRLVYAEVSDNQKPYVDTVLMAELGIGHDADRNMPDVMLYFVKKKLLLLIECVTGRGCINAKRKAELGKLYEGSAAGLVFVSAFPDREAMRQHLDEIAWETEAWVANAPSHIIHFNGGKLLGPYSKTLGLFQGCQTLTTQRGSNGSGGGPCYWPTQG